MINLSQQEWQELSNRFESVIINEATEEETQTITLLSGRKVTGHISPNRMFTIKEATELLLS